MADIEKKVFLDEAGLKLYDELIKAYITQGADQKQESIDEIFETLAGMSASITENTNALDVLNGTGEGSVQKAVEDAVANLVDGAPEALDTLKEIASWISDDTTGAASLVSRVADAEDAIEALQANDESLKDYVDAQDVAYYNSIKSIEDLKIVALFPEKQSASETAAQAIANIEEGKAVQLTANQEIAEDITITKDCYIDANGSTFSGVVTVPADANVVIENATFAQPVVVA